MSTYATGGIETIVGLYTVHTFNTSGTLTVLGGRTLSASALVVAGGGGGASGGGGAGGVLSGAPNLTGTMPVTVGSGGSGGLGGNNGVGVAGINSVFGGLTAIGGGKGGPGGTPTGPGGTGGSGGGGGAYGTAPFTTDGGTGVAGQGYAGGGNAGYGASPYPSGGGGGGGAAGASAPSASVSGAGGAGLASTITGSSVIYGGGGGGGVYAAGGTAGAGGTGGGGAGGAAASGTAGTANRGGGGGGAGDGVPGGTGGSGVVVIRYLTGPTTAPAAPTAPSATGTLAGINLAWTKSITTGGNAATGYNVYRGTAVNPTTLRATLGNVAAYADTPSGGTTYHYRITAINSDFESTYSTDVSANRIVPTTAPATPTAPSATGSTTGITVGWTKSATTGTNAATGYNVYRGTSANPTILYATLGNVATYVNAVSDATVYHYRVTATNNGFESGYTADVFATRASATLLVAWTPLTGYDDWPTVAIEYLIYETSATPPTLLATIPFGSVAPPMSRFYSAIETFGIAVRINNAEWPVTPCTVSIA